MASGIPQSTPSPLCLPLNACSFFGLFSVPAHVFPYALVLLWQLLVPQASLLGHLCGLLAGHLYLAGHLRWAQPRSTTFQDLERSAACAPFLHSPGFIAHLAGSGADAPLPVSRHSGGGGGGGGGAARSGR